MNSRVWWKYFSTFVPGSVFLFFFRSRAALHSVLSLRLQSVLPRTQARPLSQRPSREATPSLSHTFNAHIERGGPASLELGNPAPAKKACPYFPPPASARPRPSLAHHDGHPHRGERPAFLFWGGSKGNDAVSFPAARPSPPPPHPPHPPSQDAAASLANAEQLLARRQELKRGRERERAR